MKSTFSRQSVFSVCVSQQEVWVSNLTYIHPSSSVTDHSEPPTSPVTTNHLSPTTPSHFTSAAVFSSSQDFSRFLQRFVCVVCAVTLSPRTVTPTHRHTLWPLASLWRLTQKKQTRGRLQPRWPTLSYTSTNVTRSERSAGAVNTLSVYWYLAAHIWPLIIN